MVYVKTNDNEKKAFPVRFVLSLTFGVKTLLVSMKRGFLYALGQLATKSFWKKLVAAAVKEMVGAFMKTLGGKFMTYGIGQEDPEIKKTARTMEGTTASAAFSGGYQPRTSYNGFGYQSNHQSSGSSFPGMA